MKCQMFRTATGDVATYELGQSLEKGLEMAKQILANPAILQSLAAHNLRVDRDTLNSFATLVHNAEEKL